MRELEWRKAPDRTSLSLRCAVIGAGRLGKALTEQLKAVGLDALGPLTRSDKLPTADLFLLCVPDREISKVAAAIPPGPLVGHCSGAKGLDALLGHRAFSLHPLMTVTEQGAEFSGVSCAVAGSDSEATKTAKRLAELVGMRPVEIAEEDRPAYHAAASIASNFLVTLEAFAELLAAQTGLERKALVPLVDATVRNWAQHGPQQALTGPVARGDQETVAVQRQAVLERLPKLLDLFDALVAATQSLAAGQLHPQLAPVSEAPVKQATK